MSNNKIVPNLWFNADGGDISHVIEYYKRIFSKDFFYGKTRQFGDTPSGKTEVCEATIFEQKYILMNTAKEHHPLNDAVSFMLNCEDQTEIDKYWDYFTSEGEASQCGWCIDKYGLRWQVLPKNFNELLNRPGAVKIMMGQRKIVIEEYLK